MNTILVQLTKDLVAMPTVTEHIEENRKALEWIMEYMDVPQNQLHYYKDTKHPSLVITTLPHTKKIDMIFHGHIDVIPASADEFIPREENGMIYGRGTTDMKGGLAALIILFKTLIQKKTNKNLALMITTDEEIGGWHGTKYLLDEIGYTANFFLTAEGCSLAHKIVTKAKGMLMLYMEATGIPGHSARSWLGENAIEKAFATYKDITRLFPESDKKNYWHTTINLSTIVGGEALNSVPRYAKMGIDIRFTEEWKTGDTILEAIKAVLKKHPDVKIGQIYVNDAMLHTDEKNVYVHKLHTSFKKYVPNPLTGIGFAHATSDARYAAWKGIPAIEFGPKGEHAHSHRESILISELEKYYFIMDDFITSL